MKHFEAHSAAEKLAYLQSIYHVDVLPDWGDGESQWKDGTWSIGELDKLDHAVTLLANAMGGEDRFIQHLGGVIVKKREMGSHGGEAMQHRVSFSNKGTFSSWTVIHEMTHAWDANYGWKLSVELEKYTGGFTNPLLSKVRRFSGEWDAGRNGLESATGRRGRLRGCNKAGYFYGDKPSGSNWNFNRKEDFAESVSMYIGWQKDNDLSEWAEKRIKRYLLGNGIKDNNFGVDNWADYAKYFYPEDGDYTKTKRWKFVDELMRGKIAAV
ncbi:MAG: hypothetical protein H7Y59_15160 [Anaerolineales bacterium]|nr:hypothetical protein [Anaerolineales bacterium]